MRLETQTFVGAREALARRLREAREAKGLSQEVLADLAKCHRTYVGMLERRQGNPSLAVIAALAEALDVDVGNLLV